MQNVAHSNCNMHTADNSPVKLCWFMLCKCMDIFLPAGGRDKMSTVEVWGQD